MSTQSLRPDLLEISFEPADLSLYPRQREVRVRGQRVELTVLEFDALHLLLRRQGEVVSFDELSREVWGHECMGARGYISTTIHRLRRALRTVGAGDMIRAVRGIGYQVSRAVPPGHDAAAQARAFDLLQTGVVIIDDAGRFRSANRAFAEMLGYELGELLRLPSYAVLVPGALAVTYEEVIQRVLDGEPRRWKRLTVVHRDGHPLEVEVCLEPFVEADRIVGVLAEVRPAGPQGTKG